jgi:hypothetical protein
MKRERRLARLAFMGQALSYLGSAIMIPTYIIGIIRHFRMRAEAARTQMPVESPLIPRFTLSDLLLMVLSLGLFPIAIAQLTTSVKQVKSLETITFISGALCFPAYFVCALYRLEARKIPLGPARSAFLFCAPYVYFSCTACATAPLYLINKVYVSSRMRPYHTVAYHILVLIAGAILTRRLASKPVNE